MNRWTNERMTGWKDDRMNEWMNVWMKSPNDSIGTGFPTGSNKFHSPRTPIFILKLRKWEKNKIISYFFISQFLKVSPPHV